MITYNEWLDFERQGTHDYYEMLHVFLVIDAINRLFRGQFSYFEPNYISWVEGN